MEAGWVNQMKIQAAKHQKEEKSRRQEIEAWELREKMKLHACLKKQIEAAVPARDGSAMLVYTKPCSPADPHYLVKDVEEILYREKSSFRAVPVPRTESDPQYPIHHSYYVPMKPRGYFY